MVTAPLFSSLSQLLLREQSPGREWQQLSVQRKAEAQQPRSRLLLKAAHKLRSGEQWCLRPGCPWGSWTSAWWPSGPPAPSEKAQVEGRAAATCCCFCSISDESRVHLLCWSKAPQCLNIRYLVCLVSDILGSLDDMDPAAPSGGDPCLDPC